MAANKMNPQGSLNCIRGSIIIDSHSDLNVTSDYLTVEGIQIIPTDEAAKLISTNTGVVVTQAPFLPVTVTLNLVRSQALANNWYKQIKKNCSIGNVRIVNDSPTRDDISLTNCIITTPGLESLATSQVKLSIEIKGKMNINNDIWSLS
ncbi:hypothetical protein [Aristophania vespae]|uniref:hypothetical protein n=1 Tax=Aristophania vespae TaxID=2697033 RepID=UPI0023512A42|nr:hypothetical protein [Aristophania vespae]UMM63160.1 hypothetical protein DM15PD_01150 [Aristophania vespae]